MAFHQKSVLCRARFFDGRQSWIALVQPSIQRLLPFRRTVLRSKAQHINPFPAQIRHKVFTLMAVATNGLCP